MLRVFFIFCFFYAHFIQAIAWSSPEILFSSGSYDGALPRALVHPLNDTAEAVWVAQGSDYIVYTAHFDGSVWSTPNSLHSAQEETSLQLVSDGSGNYTAAWSSFDGTSLTIEAAENEGSVWSGPQSLQTVSIGAADLYLNLARPTEGAALLSWQTSDSQLHGLAYQNGLATDLYVLSDPSVSVISSSLTPTFALYTAAEGVYLATFDPGASPKVLVDQQMYSLAIKNPSQVLPTKSNTLLSLAAFQDGKSQFLLSAIQYQSIWNYSLIDIPYESVSNVQIALSTAADRAAAVWVTESGLVKAAIFNGRRWVSSTTLSSNGAAPTIAINPLNDYVIVVWADLSNVGANVIQFSEFNLSSWSMPAAISNTGNFVDAPQIDINASGQAVVIWTRKEMSGSKALVEVATGS